ncbi:EmrB/QacA subfamily drug resistance transporter [Anaerobacterium chartisolvens]|uniref:EmrB/QacA subfamily drug resistance transporter n=1 Tax=Anaerobacterium chartisolvens TaxID=1297424 RepID=A0A369B4M7_9FIRM|nr:MFS transporter [Anaerobacterium chartisolvens]RCX16512.1 EmrB/QacA subfamily drug resistance transporter [Anaerobacterium chartisolvens]
MNGCKKENCKHRKVAAFIAIILGFFMALLDTTIVNISLPKMTDYFHTNVKDISWVINGYNIAFAVLMITASRLADQFGRKKFFLFGLFAFTLSSCLSGLSTSLQMLIIFRVLQGLSAAILVPVTVPLIIEIFTMKKLGMIIGLWGAIGGLAAACGPALGGVLTEIFNWQAIFYVNLPLGIISFIFSAILLNESYDKTASRYMDIPGILAISISMLTVTFGLVQAPDKGWGSSYIITLFTVAVVSLIAFIIIELKSKEPMLPMWLMKIKSFSAATITLVFATAGLMAGSFLVAFYLTRFMGMSVLDAGMTTIAMPIAMMVFSIVGGPLSHKFGCRIFGVLGIAIASLAVFLFGDLDVASARWDVIWRLIILGAGLGMTISPVMGAAVRNAPPEKIGIASGVTNVARTFGMVLGVAILATLLSMNMNSQIENGKEKVIANISADKVFNSEFKESFIEKVRNIKVSSDSKAITLEDIIAAADQKEEEILKSTPENKKEKVKAMFDEQKQEIKNIWPVVEGDLKGSMQISFADTFRFFSLLLIFGIIPAFFSDKLKKKVDETVNLDAPSN